MTSVRPRQPSARMIGAVRERPLQNPCAGYPSTPCEPGCSGVEAEPRIHLPVPGQSPGTRLKIWILASARMTILGPLAKKRAGRIEQRSIRPALLRFLGGALGEPFLTKKGSPKIAPGTSHHAPSFLCTFACGLGALFVGHGGQAFDLL